MKKRNILFVILLCLTLAFSLAACGGDGETSTVDERVLWGTLVGTVTENETGLAGVKVTSGDESAVTDENGEYSIKVYNNGATVSFEKQGCITQRKTFKSSSFYAQEIRYDFIMYIAAKVEGTVKDKNGAPVAGADVTVGVQSVKTDEEGKFSFAQVIGTSMVVIVEYGGKTVRKAVYTEEMRTGSVNVEIVLR